MWDQSGTEGPDFHPLPIQLPGRTGRTMIGCHQLPLSLRASQLDLLRQFISHLWLRRPVSHLCWSWVPSCLSWRWVDSCPAVIQKLQMLKLQFEQTYAEAVHLVGLWVRQAPVALGDVGRHQAGPALTASSGSSRLVLPIPYSHRGHSGLCR